MLECLTRLVQFVFCLKPTSILELLLFPQFVFYFLSIAKIKTSKLWFGTWLLIILMSVRVFLLSILRYGTCQDCSFYFGTFLLTLLPYLWEAHFQTGFSLSQCIVLTSHPVICFVPFISTSYTLLLNSSFS